MSMISVVQVFILTKQENEEIYTFLKGVGANDCFTQNDFLEKYISNFKEKLNV